MVVTTTLLVKMPSGDLGMAAVNLENSTGMHRQRLILTDHLLAPCETRPLPQFQLTSPLSSSEALGYQDSCAGCLFSRMPSRGDAGSYLPVCDLLTQLCSMVWGHICPKIRALFLHCSNVSECWSKPDTFSSWFILRPLLISTQMLLKASFG